MIRLSAVIITYNEEQHIGRCLQSVAGIADEIVVVDSCSTDRTREICASYQVRFYSQPFRGYIEQKREAVSLAQGEYVLCLDADESLSEALQQSIRDEKAAGFRHQAYFMNRRSFYCGQWIRFGTFYPDRKLRLFHKQSGRWGGTNPHDRVVLQPGVHAEPLRGDLLHYTHQTHEAHEQKMDRFSSIAAQALYDKGRGPSYRKLIVNPVWGFVYAYIIRCGFLDGRNGFRIARISAWQKFQKYRKLILLHRTRKETWKTTSPTILKAVSENSGRGT